MKFNKPRPKARFNSWKKSKDKRKTDMVAVHIVTIIAVFVVAFLIQPFN